MAVSELALTRDHSIDKATFKVIIVTEKFLAIAIWLISMPVTIKVAASFVGHATLPLLMALFKVTFIDVSVCKHFFTLAT